jgi:hypothetical protein
VAKYKKRGNPKFIKGIEIQCCGSEKQRILERSDGSVQVIYHFMKFINFFAQNSTSFLINE